MTASQILTADLLDILFENRNKAYGAYVLRKEYPSNLKKAIGMMLLLVCGIAIFAFTFKRAGRANVPPGDVTKEVKIIEVKMKDEKKPAEQKAVAPKPPAKLDRVPVLVDNPNPDKFVPDRTDSTDYMNSQKNDPGNGGDPNTVMQQGTPAGTSTGTNTPPANPEPPEPAIVEHPEENPEFPGGMEAWTKYLQRMLRVPDDLEPGDRKTVKVRFVVSKEGEITDVIITQSAGTMFDKEVLRVIAKMPKWKPGKQRGKPVSSYFTQPVTFQGLEE